MGHLSVCGEVFSIRPWDHRAATLVLDFPTVFQPGLHIRGDPFHLWTAPPVTSLLAPYSFWHLVLVLPP